MTTRTFDYPLSLIRHLPEVHPDVVALADNVAKLAPRVAVRDMLLGRPGLAAVVLNRRAERLKALVLAGWTDAEIRAIARHVGLAS